MPDDAAAPARKSGWKLLANLALLVGLVGIFAWQAHKNWPEVSRYLHAGQWHWNWTYATLALVLLLLCQGCDILIWNSTLGWFSTSLPVQSATPVYIWSFLARYIPGKVGSLILRMALAAEVDRPAIPVLASSIAELALRIGSGLLLFLVALLGWGFTTDARVRLIAIVAVPLVLVCAHPRIMVPVMNWLLRKAKQPSLVQALRYRDVLRIFGALFLRWMLYGVSYALLAAAMFQAAIAHIPVLTGASAGAWAAGFILMTPGGIGTSELVQGYVLQFLAFPTAVATVLPVLARLWTLIGEGLWSLAAWVLWRNRLRIAREAPSEQPVA